MNRILILAMTVFLSLASLGGCRTVDEGNFGIQSVGGAVTGDPISPGFQMLPPWYALTEVPVDSISIQDVVQEDGVDAAQVTLEDTLQSVGYTADAEFTINGPQAAVVMYTDYQIRSDEAIQVLVQNRILPELRTAIKSSFNSYDLSTLYANRTTAASEARELWQEALNRRFGTLEGGVPVILAGSLSLSNIDYNSELEAAFAATVHENQNRELQVTRLATQEVEARSATVAANAEQDAARIRLATETEVDRTRADNAAYVRAQEAAADAEYYQALSDAGVDVNMQIQMDTWNGELPMFGNGGGTGSGVQPFVMLNTPQ